MAKIEVQPKFKDKLAKALDLLFVDEAYISQNFGRFPWWQAGLLFGLIKAFVRLLLLRNPAICYLSAIDKVKDLEVTLPEAMASVKSIAWINLILAPFFYLLLFAGIAWLSWQISIKLKGDGSYKDHISATIIIAYIILFGQLITSTLVAFTDLQHLVDLRDLTPGLGLGLLYYFSLERMGRFFWEVVRGLDLAGLAVLMIGSRLLKTINHYRRSTSMTLIFLYYALFLALRWLFEGPGHQFLLYFWTAKSI